MEVLTNKKNDGRGKLLAHTFEYELKKINKFKKIKACNVKQQGSK